MDSLNAFGSYSERTLAIMRYLTPTNFTKYGTERYCSSQCVQIEQYAIATGQIQCDIERLSHELLRSLFTNMNPKYDPREMPQTLSYEHALAGCPINCITFEQISYCYTFSSFLNQNGWPLVKHEAVSNVQLIMYPRKMIEATQSSQWI